MNTTTVSTTLQFLSGGGQMSERIRAFDWTSTPLGPPEHWSQSLKTSVNLMLNCQQPVWIGWGEENIFLYNDPYIEVLGLAKHEWALGQPTPRVWAEIWDFCGPLSDKVYQRGESSFVHDNHFFMDRGDMLEEVYYSFSYSPIYDENGKVGGLFCPNIETTDKMLNARRLRTLSELAAKTLLEKTTQAACASAFATLSQNRDDIPFALFYLLDATGEYATLEQVSGFSLEETAICPAIIDLRSFEASPWPLAEVLQTAKSQTISVSHLAELPRGLADLPVREALILPVAASGQARPLGVLIAGVNPTRRLDKEYHTFYELLAGQVATAIQNARTAEETRKQAEALAEIDRAKTVFFSNISHEFRTPLTLMLGSLEELLREENHDLPASNRATVETTHRNALRLLRLVNALLDFSRIEAGRTRAQFQRVDLAQYTADLASNFRSVMERGGLEFRVDCAPWEAASYVDKEMWEKIVLNLLSNAFKYTLIGQVNLRLFTENEEIVLTVQDTGVGIPAAELPHMFERFHRVQNVVGRSFEGTGIGLSLVNELVNMHGGTISVESQEGVGSTFMVRIPLGNSHLPTEQIIEKSLEFDSILSEAFLEESSSLLEDAGSTAGKATDENNLDTILVVDDNADMRAHIKGLLQRHYHIVTANNGAEAMYHLAEKLPALVLSDIMMPVMDGLEMLKAIKENPRTAQLPVVLLSARAGEEARIEGFDGGADDYLVKPFSAKELLARVQSQIRLVRSRAHAYEQIRNLFLQAPTAIQILRGPNFVIELANNRVLELWGRTEAEVINRPLFDIIPEVEAQGYHQLLTQVYQSGQRFVADEIPLNFLRDGQLVKSYAKLVYEPMREPDGSISGIMVVGDDITPQVLARQKIEESESRFRTLAETLPQLVWMTDQNGFQEYASSRWEEYTGIQPTGADTWAQMVHPDDIARIGNAWQASMIDGSPYRIEVRLKSKQGDYRWHFVHGEPIRDAQGQIIKWIGAFTDIHDQKNISEKLEQQVVERTTALYESNASLEANNRQLLRVNEELESFNYVASHDLQEPLRKIQTFANLLQIKKHDEEAMTNYLNRITSASQRMSELVQALLQYSRLSNENEFVEINLNNIVEDVKTDFELSIEETNAVISVASLPTICAIPLQMQQLFTNLIGNALKFTKRSPVITISSRMVPIAEIEENQQLTNGKTYVEITVRDNGIGFDAHHAEQIFQLFKRLHSREEYSGTGIGLSICKKIVDNHHGSIRAESVVDEGTAFVVTLPVNR